MRSNMWYWITVAALLLIGWFLSDLSARQQDAIDKHFIEKDES